MGGKSELAETSNSFGDLAGLGSGQVSDAMESLGMRRKVITGFALVSQDSETVVAGPAFTVLQGPKREGSSKEENRMRQGEVVANLAEPGDVIVIDMAGRTDICTWGENQSLKSHSRGIAGLVVNGAIRDSVGIRKSGFSAFCLGFSPVASRWDLETIAIGEPLVIKDVQIRPGDIVFGDADGIIVIPSDRAAEVFDRAREILVEEAARRARMGL